MQAADVLGDDIAFGTWSVWVGRGFKRDSIWGLCGPRKRSGYLDPLKKILTLVESFVFMAFWMGDYTDACRLLRFLDL